MGRQMIRSIFSFLLALTMANPAAAEVCEVLMKGPWRGQFTAIDQLLFMMAGPFMVVPAILLGLAILAPWYRLKAAIGVAFVALGGLYIYDWFWPLGKIVQLARTEGCQGNPVLFVALLAMVGALIIWRAFAQRDAA